MTRIHIDWGGAGTIVTARTHLDTDTTGRIHLPDATSHPITGPTTITLDPTDPGEAWRIRCYPTGRTPWTWWVTIPDTTDVLALADLPRVDPATASPVVGPEQSLWAAQLEQERQARAADLAAVRTALAETQAVPADVVTAEQLDAALAALPAGAVSHVAVTETGRLAHRAGGTTTLTTTTGGRLAAVRA